MAIPGPKPKPARLKLVEGNPGKRPVATNTAHSALPPTAPPEPEWAEVFRKGQRAGYLKLRNDARKAWREVVPHLDSVGLLSRVDAVVLQDYAVCVARLAEAERNLTAYGLVVNSERGYVKNPATTIAGQYRTALKFYVAELGLAPSSRGRLTVGGGGEDDAEGLLD